MNLMKKANCYYIEVITINQLSQVIFADRTVTVYNKYQYKNANNRVITEWYYTNIPNCLRVGGIVIGGIGDIKVSENSNRVQIPIFDNYVEPFDYARLPNDEMCNKFTFQNGDRIVLNEVNDDIVDGLFSILDLDVKYGTEIFTIKNINHYYNDNFPLKFIEVCG